MKLIKSLIIVYLLLYATTSWSNQVDPKEALIEYLNQIQQVKFIEVKTKEDSYDLIFKNSYKALRKKIIPEESKFSRGEGPSHFDVYTSYTVDKISLKKDTAEFLITYKEVGYILGGSIFCPRIREDKARVKLKLVKNVWKIESRYKYIPLAHSITISGAKKYFKLQNRHLVQWEINQAYKQLSDLSKVNKITIYDTKLSYDTILGLLFFDGQFDLIKSTNNLRNSVKAFDKLQLQRLRNVVYAKHQYKFKDKELRKYFNLQFSSNLYAPLEDNIKLTEIDKNNINFIKTIESKK